MNADTTPVNPLQLKEKLGFSVGEFASSLVWQTLMFFLPIFYTDTFGLTAGAVGTLFLVVRIFDAFTDPAMGMLADRTQTRWGSFRPYLLWLAIPYGIGMVLMFSTPSFSPVGKLIWAYGTYALMMLLYTAITIPYNTMIGVISPRKDDQISVSSLKFVFAFLAGFTVQLLIIPMVQRLGEGNPARGYQISMTIFGTIGALLFLLTFASCKERVKPSVNQKTTLKTDLADLAKNQPWVILFFFSLLLVSVFAIRSAVVAYYFKYVLQLESQSGIFMAVGTACVLFGVLPSKWLSSKFGKVRILVICTLLVAVTCAAFFFLKPGQIVAHYAVQILYSLACGPLFPILWSMYADTADYNEWKTGRRATGLVFSASTFSQKMGFSAGGAVIMLLLSWFGFVANELQTDRSLMGIRLCLSLLPAAMCVISAGLLRIYKLDDSLNAKIEQELEKRRSLTS